MSARTYAAEEVWELQGKVEVEDDGMSRGKAGVRIASSRDALRYTYISLRLWKELGDGEITSLASLSVSHYLKHNQPLRIAIDEAGFRFNNLTEAQVYHIQQVSNEPAYRGIEKNLFYRLCHLLRLGIQCIFIFDGAGKPWKLKANGVYGTSGRPGWEKTKPVKDLLNVLKIPYHTAPGEAEAECARLQQEGVVDAVWSEDADALMFGAEMLIRDYREPKKKSGPQAAAKENTKKSKDLVRVYRMDDVKRKLKLDREGLVCFTVLNGGDYDEGIRGCGPRSSIQAARKGMGTSLYAYPNDFQMCLRTFRSQVVDHFQHRFDVPEDFPKEVSTWNYCHPKVSNQDQLRNLRLLKDGWGVPIDEEKLRAFISSHFNIWTKGYLDWIGPILLVRSLLATAAAGEKTNKHDIKLVKRRKKKVDPNTMAQVVGTEDLPDAEIKLTLNAKSLTSLNYDDLDDGHWLGKVGTPADLDYRPDCLTVNHFLRRALPEEFFVEAAQKPTPRKSKKRKAEMDEASPAVDSSTKRSKAAAGEAEDDRERRTQSAQKSRVRPRKTAKGIEQTGSPPPTKATFTLPSSHEAFEELERQFAGQEATTDLPSGKPPTYPIAQSGHIHHVPDNPYLLNRVLETVENAIARLKRDPLAPDRTVDARSPIAPILASSDDEENDEELKLAISLSLREAEARRPESAGPSKPYSDAVASASSSSSMTPRSNKAAFPFPSAAVQSVPAAVTSASREDVRAARLAHFDKVTAQLPNSSSVVLDAANGTGSIVAISSSETVDRLSGSTVIIDLTSD